MDWRRLLRWALVSGIVEYLVLTVTAGEVIPPLVVIGLVLAVAAFLLRRPGKAGPIVAIVGLVVFLASNLAFGSGDLAEYRSFPSFSIASAALVTAIVGLVAAVAALRSDGVSGKAQAIALGSAAAVVGLLAVNGIATIAYDDPAIESGDVALVAQDIAWSTEQLSAPAGRVTFYLDNGDAVLHNFNIKGVGTVSMPAAHSARKTFDLSAGTYTYVCDFHEEDMKGTLTVT